MRCTDPRTVGFKADGKTIAWSQKEHSKQFASFQLPCGKCIECRLDYARQWAIRCVHEAQIHPENSFITLTYDQEHLVSDRLVYEDFQKFMKRLRKTQNQPIGFFVTGEYGDKQKRPHWHACLFNYAPRDAQYKYSNDRGDKVFESETLTKIWGNGIAEFGSVTFESAGYCARYAAKKLVHGHDGTHGYEPISKKSSKHAIGKKWLERFYPDVFNQGYIVLPNGKTCSIPRYYEKWLKENQPEEWLRYVTQIKSLRWENADLRSQRESDELRSLLDTRIDQGRFGPIQTRKEARKKITEQKFKQLQERLKL